MLIYVLLAILGFYLHMGTAYWVTFWMAVTANVLHSYFSD